MGYGSITANGSTLDAEYAILHDERFTNTQEKQ